MEKTIEKLGELCKLSVRLKILWEEECKNRLINNGDFNKQIISIFSIEGTPILTNKPSLNQKKFLQPIFVTNN